ncbi:6-methylsalicylic acid synthase [Truncatella angustata]|uniref:6-methylsalicylic acid synthase n=1 Tax=Truncatella angustata TaxID=152316 RepID=A0A9P8UJR6_9PEZI|nr:6-methylsalicylic acid synthase [Truncatella angustata]KAH6653270.1 6-methylsalicylic acid synthase [Truncatella angustata]
MSCRTAGGNNTPEKLWEFLMDQKSASGEVPRWRWEPWLRRDVRNARELEKTIDRGYFIEDLENFDAAFFGISPKEAEQMDPHQRLALELSWEALENAGVDPKRLSGSDTAVFMGIDTDDYSRLLIEDLPNIEAWMGIGTAFHGVPNRISYHLDLMGPSVAVDAACASSLVAIHLGRQAILNGESGVAIVGGVHVLVAPGLTRMLGKAGALSPDGICRSFDDAANGYARGEGGAVVILKRLSAAIADGDNILAICKGTAVAQDGKTNGIMAPNAKAQELVARQALDRAGIDAHTVTYVEAHATSTPLGDPTEISAISAVYGAGSGRPLDEPVMVGSIKPNVGHLEAAAGAIGMVKAILAMKHGKVPPQAYLTKLNSRIDWKNSGLNVVQAPTDWSNKSGPRRAAICSYGYGGTVSHAVIEEFIYNAASRLDSVRLEEPHPVILTISAAQEKRLSGQALKLSQWLDTPKARSTSLAAVARTLALRRAHHDYRAAFAVSSHEEAVEALERFAAGSEEISDNSARGRVLQAGNGPARHAAWVFSGHGAQWTDMGKELLHDAAFRKAIATLESLYLKEAGFSLVKALENGDFESSERVQSLTYAMQIGLSQVLRSKGLEPQAVIGHSVGEIAASVVGGCLTPEEGALIVIRRAKLYGTIRALTTGGMALVNRPYDEVAAELTNNANLCAAIDSSPSTCVISGEETAVREYVETQKARGIKTFRVETDIAFHSPILEQLAAPLKEALAGSLKPQIPNIPVYSTSNTDPRTPALRDIEYWVNNMIRPVLLKSAVNAAAADGYRVFVEVSSHPIVLHSVNETLLSGNLDEEDFVTVPTMKRGRSALGCVWNALAQLYVSGAEINFAAQLKEESQWCQTVPGTPWLHKPYWKQVETGPLNQEITHDVDKHTLLGQRITVGGTDTVMYTTKLDDKVKPFPGTHPLDGTEIIPAAVYINTFHSATGATVLSDIKLNVPVSISEETRNVQIIVEGHQIKVASSTIAESEDAEQYWVAHSSCHWSKADADSSLSQSVDVEAIKKRIGTLLPNTFAVDYLTQIGVEGIAFPWQVIEHYGNAKEMIAKVDMDPEAQELSWDPKSWAPLLDAATSVGSSIFFTEPKLRIVSQIDRVSLHSSKPPPKIGYLFIQEATDAQSPASHVSVLDEQGLLLAKFTSMRFSGVEDAVGASGSVDSLVHRMDWIPPKFSEKPRRFAQVVVVSTDHSTASRYLEKLQAENSQVLLCLSAEEMGRPEVVAALAQKDSAVIYIPGQVDSINEVSTKSTEFIWETTSIVKLLLDRSESTSKVFVVTDSVFAGKTTTGLAHGALYGLARIIAAEHPDIWGGLIDNDKRDTVPSLALKYVQDQDVLRFIDGMPRRAILRPLLKSQRHEPESSKSLLPKPEGTYIITGGLGALGLRTCNFLVENGARRIVLLSRQGLPPRRKWPELVVNDEKLSATVQLVQEFEKAGASIHPVALDIAAEGAAQKLQEILDNMSLPPVLGVVHAAGVLEDSLVLETSRESFERVLAPKVRGALALHEAFPPRTLDFFVLYSSIGQLVGTAGQASYGSGNAFLDALATYRRDQGDNSVAFQWTAWRGSGMGTSEFLAVELQSKGITDVSDADAFRAWKHLSRYDIDNAVVTRCLAMEEGEPVAVPLLEDVVVRKPRSRSDGTASGGSAEEIASGTRKDAVPDTPEKLQEWLTTRIRECIAAVLMITDIEDIDPRMPVSDLGVDSVMTVALRQKLQTVLKVKVPPTLTWNHPTVNHLVAWFTAKMGEATS